MSRKTLMLAVIVTAGVLALACWPTQRATGQQASTAPAGGASTRPAAAPQRVFAIDYPVRTVEEFEQIAAIVEPLKRHGRVEMDISNLSGPALSQMPPAIRKPGRNVALDKQGDARSPWYDYASYQPCLERFFPPEKLAKFMDAQYVAANRRLLEGSVAVCRKYSYGQVASFHTPFYLPEEFFEAYPHLRGPRVDHPRRSVDPAYSMCVDQKEVLDMYQQMMAKLVEAAPELSSVEFKSNDAGAGLCWASWLYTGRNGPIDCERTTTAARVGRLIEVFRRGAGDHKVAIRFTNFFNPDEMDGVRRAGDGGQRGAWVSARVNNPVRGMWDPVGICRNLERVARGGGRISMDFGNDYQRGGNTHEVVQKVVELVDAYLSNPPRPGLLGRLEFVRGMCEKWVGPRDAESLMETLVSLGETLSIERASLASYDLNYVGVSMRMLTRPLVIAPQLLEDKEKSYWLDKAFTANPSQTLMDYLEGHGGRRASGMAGDEGWPRMKAAETVCGRLGGISSRLQRFDRSGDSKVFHDMGLGVGIYASLLRSIHNASSMQVVRDRNAEALAATQPVVQPLLSGKGDSELHIANEFIRDEMDNTRELIALLEKGGLDMLAHAPTAELEDSFWLGPDVLEQLKLKLRIMQAHARDGELFFVTPNK